MTDPYARHDAALAVLRPYGPNLANGFINHAPMVVEALAAMGRGETALSWLRAEEHNLLPRAPAQPPVEAAGWREALGKPARFEAWAAFFAREIETNGWRATLDRWARRLSAGYGTAAVHGVIRTAHAARALAWQDTALRRGELAQGLAVWAARYAPLAADLPAPAFGTLPPHAALAAVTPVALHWRVRAGSITAGLANLARAPGFARETAGADLSGEPLATADALVCTFAELFLDAARNGYTAIVFAHAVTGAAAARNLLPLVGPGAQRALIAGAWQTGCALKAVFYPPAPGAGRPVPARRTPDRLAEAAAVHGDDHAIKLAEACLSAYARTGRRRLLKTIALALTLLDPREREATDPTRLLETQT